MLILLCLRNRDKAVDQTTPGGVYSLIWVVRVRAAGQGMVFVPSATELKNDCACRELALERLGMKNINP